jgi:hypothetical protein
MIYLAADTVTEREAIRALPFVVFGELVGMRIARAVLASSQKSLVRRERR